MLKFILVLVFVFCVAFSEAFDKGDSCNNNGVVGVCTDLKECSTAQSDLDSKKSVHMCQQKGKDQLVCCINNANTRNKRYASQPQIKEECKPTESKTGRKALDKCVEYQQKLVYPCVPSILPGEGKSKGNNCCGHDSDALVVGGPKANEGQFPHMALLGYGQDKIEWLCSGSVISEKFILTVAHCINPKSRGQVTNVRVGTLSRSNKSGKIYKVKSNIVHPDYSEPLVNNDIALVETEKEIEFSNLVIPACLPVDLGPVEKAEVSSWLRPRGETKSDELHKFTMVKFSDENCSSTYKPSRRQDHGIDFKSQLCFGHSTGDADSCRILSGAPLQVENKKVSCMYTLVGVTSYGALHCPTPTPDVYSKVEYFLPWIESIVFP